MGLLTSIGKATLAAVAPEVNETSHLRKLNADLFAGCMVLAKEGLEKEWEANEIVRSQVARDESYKQTLIVMRAENIAVDELIIPPHWTGIIECERCGVMPYLPACHSEKVDFCPWCSSKGLAAYRKELAELKKTKLLGVEAGRRYSFDMTKDEFVTGEIKI